MASKIAVFIHRDIEEEILATGTFWKEPGQLRTYQTAGILRVFYRSLAISRFQGFSPNRQNTSRNGIQLV